MEIDELIELAKRRRSIRKLLPDPFPDKYIDKILEVAPRFITSRGVGYIADAAPGRHTASTLQIMLERGAPLGDYPELLKAARTMPKGGRELAVANKYQAMVSAAGLCFFALMPGSLYPLIEFVAAATGWDFRINEALTAGHRIQTLRQAFIIREGISPGSYRLPERMSREFSEGPLAGEVHDFDALKSSFYEAMGWESQGANSGHPLEMTLQELELDNLVAKI